MTFDSEEQKRIVIAALDQMKVPLGQSQGIIKIIQGVVNAEVVPPSNTEAEIKNEDGGP